MAVFLDDDVDVDVDDDDDDDAAGVTRVTGLLGLVTKLPAGHRRHGRFDGGDRR